MSEVTEELKQQFLTAIHRQSHLMFDNLGIRVNMSGLPSTQQWREAQNRLYGAGWLSRLWCRKLRPLLMPGLQQRYEDALLFEQERRQMEFMNAVLEQGKQAGYIE